MRRRGHHVARLEPREGGAGARVQRLDQALRGAQVVVARAGHVSQARVVARGEKLQVLFRDLQGQAANRVAFLQAAQLQAQAFPRRACADAGGLEVLQVPQRDRELLEAGLGLLRKQAGDFLERLGQVAVFVEDIDQQGDEGAVTIAEIDQRQLGEQVIAQRRGIGRGEVAVAFLVVGPAPVGGEIARPVVLRRGGLGFAFQ